MRSPRTRTKRTRGSRPSDDYKRGYVAGLKRARRHLHECHGRDVEFMVRFPNAPRWQFLYSKHAALHAEAMITAIDNFIEKTKPKKARKR